MPEEQENNHKVANEGVNPQQVADDMVEAVKDSAQKTQQALDEGLSAASDAVKNGVATARVEYGKAYERSQTFIDTGIAHSRAALDGLFYKLKDGVETAMEHPNTSYAVGIGFAAIVLPGPRRFLWRQTLGRFQSEEAMYKSAEAHASVLKQSIEGYTAEAQKLAERLAAAQEQYSAGLSKLKATNRQLQSLQYSVASAEKSAASLIGDLRELPSSHALKLRSEVAMQLAAAKAQRAALDRQIYKLSKKGF